MRLAQIARKVGMTPQDVRRFLENEFELNIGNEPNYKLDDNQVDAVLENFPIPEIEENPIKTITRVAAEDGFEVIPEKTTDEVIEPEIIETPPIETAPIMELVENESVETEDEAEEITEEIIEEIVTLDDPPVLSEEKAEPIISQKEARVVEINYESESGEESEHQSFQQAAVDPNAELIKAPTIKLDGLKILGKIELPENKKEVEPQSEEEIEAQELDVIAELDAAMQSQVQDVKATAVINPTPVKKAVHQSSEIDDSEAFSIYKDKRGNYRFTLEQRANRAKSLAGSDERKKLEAAKNKKKRHYDKIAAQRKEAVAAASTKKVKSKKVISREQKRQVEQKPKPTSLWGKFVHWLND